MESYNADYKQKYLGLKMKFMESVDTAFRLGFEQGSTYAQQNMMAQQNAMQQEGLNEEVGRGFGAEGSPAGEEQMKNPNGEDSSIGINPMGSELDQHISTLEDLISKSESNEYGSPLNKALGDLKAFAAQQKFALEMKKSEMAVKTITKNLSKPQVLGKQFQANTNKQTKESLNMHEKIVSNIMKAWDEQESKTSKSIDGILLSEKIIED